ncbi:cyclic nucleotide-binding domain-containing protein [Brevibacillus antibioticus]|uniref:Cyclic nucleotide-binding domain-containing protein n=1 Tax=Brevibacillus antibioticus TaxID=2570228 RepID=A0A4U2Y800_9BACL|nr:cyclic nucleotide-binding domain-containing protein [Brevibacillus antibioticus]TKI56325.1 cyclic nucleotide-binding domain-containing protein [Brevibacillus antibioticus]
MKEIENRELLQQYLHEHQLASVFYEPFLPHLSLYQFDQGEFICAQGESACHLYVLVKGKVKVFTTSPEGKTLILSIKKPLEVIGDIEYVRGISYQNSVEAASSVQMIGIHYRWLKKYGTDYAPLLEFLLQIITNKFCVKSNSLSINLLYPVEVRFARYLLSVSIEEWHPANNEEISTSNLLDAANMIGTSYRHLNRVIQQFCKEGLIERANGHLLIKNREGLAKTASETPNE